MDSVDLSVFKTLQKWLEADLTVWLVTGSAGSCPGAGRKRSAVFSGSFQ